MRKHSSQAQRRRKKQVELDAARVRLAALETQSKCLRIRDSPALKTPKKISRLGQFLAETPVQRPAAEAKAPAGREGQAPVLSPDQGPSLEDLRKEEDAARRKQRRAHSSRRRAQ